MQAQLIRVFGAREHNLRNLDVELPKDAMTVVTGLSGSGKSSLVFDTIAAESQRQLNETYTTFVRNRLPRYGQPDVDAMENLSAAIVVDQKRLGGGSRSTVGTVTDIYALMRLLWSRVGTPFAGDSTVFSFNDPEGMCPECQGLGTVRAVDVDALLDRSRSLNEGAIRFPHFRIGGWMWRAYAESGLFDLDKPLAEYSEQEWNALLHGVPEGTEPLKSGRVRPEYEGLLPRFERIWLPKDVDSLRGNTKEAFERVVTVRTCPVCEGTRLSERARSSRIDGRSIADAVALEVGELAEVVRAIDAPEARPVLTALIAQLERLDGIGLGYLTLDRRTSTLSGGESQRVKMVRHLGSSLTGMTYIFDEPSVGLHPQDVAQLITLLHTLRDKGNTILVVEHDPDVVRAADHVVDLGPGAGADGGQIVYQGDVAGLTESGTLTGRYLGQRPSIKPRPREPRDFLRIRGAARHNLQGVDADIPVGVLTVVTGVAGSGKSTLIHGFLPKAAPDAVVVDQRPIHGSRRSSPATYTGILDQVRTLFAKANGVSASLFSPNSDGACPRCRGLGVIYTDLAFLDPMVSTCELCDGNRFTAEVLGYTYGGRSINDVLNLSVIEAGEVFDDPRIAPALRRMTDVGLGYLTLGQPLNTLSGGERQRLKLAVELENQGGTYVFDEPTTGLHPSDVAGLLEVFDHLVTAGGTVVVIEHNLDVISKADWLIDLGPGPGRYGGRVLFQGPPAELRHPESRTARFLLARSPG